MTIGEIITSIITIAILVVFFYFLGYFLFYWLPGYSGLWRAMAYRKVQKLLGYDYEFKPDIVKECEKFIRDKWKWKHVKFYTKHNLRREEYLYTYLSLKKVGMKGGN